MEDEPKGIHLADIKNAPPKYDRDLSGEGLLQGIEKFTLTKNDRKIVKTIGRYVCDACILVVRHPDGTSDVVLSHFLSTDLHRQAHAELFTELDIPYGPDDTSEALILTSQIIDRENDGFRNLIDAITQKNNNQPPHIEKIAAPAVFKHGSDIVFKQSPKKDGYTQEITIKGKPNYRSRYRHRSPIYPSRRSWFLTRRPSS